MIPILLSVPPELISSFNREVFLKLIFRNDTLYTECLDYISLGVLRTTTRSAVHIDVHLLITYFMGIYYSRFPVNRIYLNVDPQLDAIMRWSEDVLYLAEGWVLLSHVRHPLPPSWLSSLDAVRLISATITVEQTLLPGTSSSPQ